MSSDPSPWESMRTFAIEPDHPLVRRWAPLCDAIRIALEQGVPLYQRGLIAVYRQRRTIKPSPRSTDGFPMHWCPSGKEQGCSKTDK